MMKRAVLTLVLGASSMAAQGSHTIKLAVDRSIVEGTGEFLNRVAHMAMGIGVAGKQSGCSFSPTSVNIDWSTEPKTLFTSGQANLRSAIISSMFPQGGGTMTHNEELAQVRQSDFDANAVHGAYQTDIKADGIDIPKPNKADEKKDKIVIVRKSYRKRPAEEVLRGEVFKLALSLGYARGADELMSMTYETQDGVQCPFISPLALIVAKAKKNALYEKMLGDVKAASIPFVETADGFAFVDPYIGDVGGRPQFQIDTSKSLSIIR